MSFDSFDQIDQNVILIYNILSQYDYEWSHRLDACDHSAQYNLWWVWYPETITKTVSSVENTVKV